MSEAKRSEPSFVGREEPAASTPTLAEVLARHGHRSLPPSLVPALSLAVRAHTQRFRDEAADRPDLNRSTMLWAVLVTNPDVALAAAEGGLATGSLKDKLRITVADEPPGDLPTSITLDPTLAQALDQQLSTDDAQALDPLSVATAILQSCTHPGGLLPQRLRDLRVDPAAVLAPLAARRARQPAGFSRSVREARRRLGPDTAATAADLVRALAEIHPIKKVLPLTEVTNGEVATTDTWLTRVGALYDAVDVLSSPRGIVDTELVIRGLVELEPALSARVDQDGAALAWLEAVRPAPAAERRTAPSADVPAQVDLLGRETLARTLLRQLEQIVQGGENSMLVHIDGPWGSGKSSLMVFLRRALDTGPSPALDGAGANGQSERDRPSYLVVDVNAWREQRVGAQWWTLYRALREAHLSQARSWAGRLTSRLEHLGDVITVRRYRVWPVLLSVMVLLIAAVVVSRLDIWPDPGIPEALSVAVLVTTGLTGAYRFLVPLSPKSARAMVENSTNPMGEVRELFARSVTHAGPRRVVFLIDDLDRCEPDYVIKFLEVVQTLVRDAPCDDPPGRGRGGSKGPLAIVAADGLWLRSSYENAFGKLMHDDVPGKPVGYRFLEKIFQMHVRLPGVEPATKQRYFESLLFPSSGSAEPTETPTAEDEKLTREVSKEIRSVRTTGDLSALNASISRITDAPTRHHLRSTALQHAVTEEVVHRQIHELSSFADLLDANPRTIRLFVNAVSMQAYLRFLEGATFELSLLALWAVLEQRWPALADHLRAHPEHVTVRAGDVPPDDLPKELFDLLTGREVDRVLRSQRWRPFTPDRVLACTGGRLDG